MTRRPLRAPPADAEPRVRGKFPGSRRPQSRAPGTSARGPSPPAAAARVGRHALAAASLSQSPSLSPSLRRLTRCLATHTLLLPVSSMTVMEAPDSGNPHVFLDVKIGDEIGAWRVVFFIGDFFEISLCG